MSTVVFSARQAPSINTLYVFGDSLSDTGTVFRATGGLYPSDPPYFQGRYSNGRVWVEYLADYLAVDRINNFACGGATTEGNATSLVPGLLSQVQSFTQNHPHA
ncbi:MAG TPA: SGNH/GDSL hydrolase family protein, partial [Allocoleopsis sp.]